MRIDCREGASAGPLTAPFQLNRNGETIALFDAQTNRMDVLRYGPVADNFTVGLIDGRLQLCEPTPLAANRPAALGSLSTVKINEFLANPEGGDDWIELHNAGALPVSLQGCAIVTSNAVARIAAPLFIFGGGFLVLQADEQPGADHLNLKLPASGGSIGLLSPAGESLDAVSYNAQLPGVSTGRLPDGTGPFQPLPFSSTPGSSNYLAQLGTGLRISEVLARAEPGPDWVEIENIGSTSLPLANLSLGVEAAGEKMLRWPFPAEAKLTPNARLLLFFGTFPKGVLPPLNAIVSQ